MPDSPISATPYEVLGVSPLADTDELRRAYRRKLRETHPDTGGAPETFHAVQHAWELIGDPRLRAAYDRGASGSAPTHPAWAPPAPRKRASRLIARSYGHPGGWRREQYLALIREWAGRGATLDDPYDPALVRAAPREIRHVLADAIAEEDTARAISALGIGFTVWHDVATSAGRGGPHEKIDHVVLASSGLFAILSEDWGEKVAFRRGEIIGPGLGDGERPFHTLSLRARTLARTARIRFTTLVVVVPDGASPDGVAEIGRMRGADCVVVQRSRLQNFLRTGTAASSINGTDLFDARTRLQESVRFV